MDPWTTSTACPGQWAPGPTDHLHCLSQWAPSGPMDPWTHGLSPLPASVSSRTHWPSPLPESVSSRTHGPMDPWTHGPSPLPESVSSRTHGPMVLVLVLVLCLVPPQAQLQCFQHGHTCSQTQPWHHLHCLSQWALGPVHHLPPQAQLQGMQNGQLWTKVPLPKPSSTSRTRGPTTGPHPGPRPGPVPGPRPGPSPHPGRWSLVLVLVHELKTLAPLVLHPGSSDTWKEFTDLRLGQISRICLSQWAPGPMDPWTTSTACVSELKDPWTHGPMDHLHSTACVSELQNPLTTSTAWVSELQDPWTHGPMASAWSAWSAWSASACSTSACSTSACSAWSASFSASASFNVSFFKGLGEFPLLSSKAIEHIQWRK